MITLRFLSQANKNQHSTGEYALLLLEIYPNLDTHMFHLVHNCFSVYLCSPSLLLLHMPVWCCGCPRTHGSPFASSYVLGNGVLEIWMYGWSVCEREQFLQNHWVSWVLLCDLEILAWEYIRLIIIKTYVFREAKIWMVGFDSWKRYFWNFPENDTFHSTIQKEIQVWGEIKYILDLASYDCQFKDHVYCLFL